MAITRLASIMSQGNAGDHLDGQSESETGRVPYYSAYSLDPAAGDFFLF